MNPSEAIRRLTGIHAATVCPMLPDFSVDWDALAAHVGHIGRAAGMQGLLINGHAGENFLLTRDEKRRVIEVCRSVLGPGVFLTSGINAESSLDAALHAADAEEAGADALLVFPPNAWIGFQDRPSARLHHEHVIAACGLPILLYQAPVGAGQMPYGPETLAELVGLPRVVGIKEGSWEVATYDQNRRVAKAVRPELAVLGSGDEHLLSCYLIGSEGSQVSLAAVTPDPIVALWDAAAREDWTEARRLHDVIYPLACAIYREKPAGRATPRLKACLKILGRLAHDTVRPPFASLPREEYVRLEKALAAAGALA